MIRGLLFLLLSTSVAMAQGRPGVGVDGKGDAVVDPTENVKALSEAAAKRQDDLRLLQTQALIYRIEAVEKLISTRDEHIKELMAMSDKRLDEVSKLRAEYNERLAVAEAKRIDAIRAVDVNAVAVASTRATDQAQVLATQVSQSAEALRALVATTAATVAASQQQLSSTLSARLTTLEQAGYQQAGKQTLQDPAFVALITKVEALTQARTQTSATSEGRSDVIGWVVAGIMMLIAFGGMIIALFAMRNARVDNSKQPS